MFEWRLLTLDVVYKLCELCCVSINVCLHRSVVCFTYPDVEHSGYNCFYTCCHC